MRFGPRQTEAKLVLEMPTSGDVHNPNGKTHLSTHHTAASLDVPASSPTQPTPKKIHPCPWEGCERYFACQHNVKQHIREKHTHEKPYQCTECAKQGRDSAFSRPFGLTRHMWQVHKMRIGPGKGCGKRQDSYDEPAPALVKQEVPGEFGDMAALLQAAISGETAATAQAQQTGVEEFQDMAALQQAAVTATIDHWYNDQASALNPIGDMAQPGGFVRETDQSYRCGICNDGFATADVILGHLHAAHNARSSRLCPCIVCQAAHFVTKDDKTEQARLLRSGGFGVNGDGGVYGSNKLATPTATPDMETELPDSASGDLFLDFGEE